MQKIAICSDDRLLLALPPLSFDHIVVVIAIVIAINTALAPLLFLLLGAADHEGLRNDVLSAGVAANTTGEETMIIGGSATTPAIALEALQQHLGHIALFLGEESFLDGDGQEKFLTCGLLALGKVIILLPLEDVVHQGREVAHELVDLLFGCLGQFLLLGFCFLLVLFLLLRRLVDVHIISFGLLGGLFCAVFGY